MKTLNKITLDDVCKGINASYKKDFTIYYIYGNCRLFYKNNYIDSFCIYSKTVQGIKKEIKKNIAFHDIHELLKMPIDYIKSNSSIKSDSIEKLYSYCVLKNDTDRKHKKLNEYLLNEIKEYFIYRLVRD